jgi:hypothetical protein
MPVRSLRSLPAHHMQMMLALLASYSQSTSGFVGTRTIIAVNAGGPSFVASDEIVYEADRYHNGAPSPAVDWTQVVLQRLSK